MTIKKGDKYGRLTAVKFIEIKKNGHQYWLFKCDCGNEKIICVNNVKRGNTKSCGCLYATHGMYGTRAHTSWKSMKGRCLNKNYSDYKNYGGRGIKVCKEWLTFENFFEDMGERPENKSLDRIDNNKGYSKENCKWSTQKEQMNNTRRNHLLTYKGKTQNIKQWSEEVEINYSTLCSRISQFEWSISKAFQKNNK